MPVDPAFAATLALIGVGLTASGGLVGSVLAFRASRIASTVQVEAHRTTREHQLIDQLQEELDGHRTATNTRLVEQERRMNAVEARNHELMRERDAYRDHAHELRSHIWDGKPPPPPDWPEGLPR